MNWDEVEGKWEQLKGKVRQTWGRLTDDDLTAISGNKQQLIGRLQTRYGYEAERAEEEINKFTSTCGCSSNEDKTSHIVGNY